MSKKMLTKILMGVTFIAIFLPTFLIGGKLLEAVVAVVVVADV